MIPAKCCVAAIVGVLALTTSPTGGVHALFDLEHAGIGPFPSDIFTVADGEQNTGRRMNVPYPDCAVHPSDCQDLDVINGLDGFDLQPRISVAFDGPIDAATITSRTVFLIPLGSALAGTAATAARPLGINQVVWDALTNTAHVESDELLDQHSRYALVVTNGVRDGGGRPVEASDAFRAFRQIAGAHSDQEPGRDQELWRSGRQEYKHSLLEAIHAARRLGVRETDVVTASVFTTQSITPVMERIRDQVKSGTPAPLTFRLGPFGESAVFSRLEVASIVWRQHTTVTPTGFATTSLDLTALDVVPGAVAAIAYGTFESPVYRVPGEYIAPVGTRTEVPPIQGYERISATLFLPSGVKPSAGWPVVIVGVAAARHAPMAALAATLASRGLATIGINAAGTGFGPLGSLTLTRKDGRTFTIPDRGRSVDQNGDNLIGASEGSVAAPPRAWTVGERDSYRQTAIDLLQLVRVIEVGVDVDEDGAWEVDPGRIFHLGFSAGAMHGAMFVALEPNLSAAVESNAGGMAPEHGRWSPVRRPSLGSQLQARTPALINSPGLTSIDGVAVAGPHFDENKPLRDVPPVVNTLAAAIDIQTAFEMHEWGQQAGQSPVVWAPYVRAKPLSGVTPKPVLYHFARGDQQANNPGTAAFLRAGDLADRTLHYRHDFALAEDAAMPKNPHQVLISPMHPNATFRAISRALQAQIAAFFASGGTLVVHPEPARFFEVPLTEPASERLNYAR